MDVFQIAFQKFNSALQESRVVLSDIEKARVQREFNFQAVQRYIDDDIQRARKAAPIFESDRVAREREEYHRQNIINIVQTVARRVAIEKRDRPYQILTESKTAEFRGFVKTAAARGCDVYPC